jgi:hypothetical protein
MGLKKSFVLLVAVSLILISTGLIFGQDDTNTTTIPPSMTLEPTMPELNPVEPEAQWVWGEVVSVDAANNQINVKFLDYETDVEKEVAINVDDKTTYENVQSINEIKPKDTVSIDYIVNPDGQNIARSISIEKAEEPPREGPENLPPPIEKEESAPVPPSTQ